MRISGSRSVAVVAGSIVLAAAAAASGVSAQSPAAGPPDLSGTTLQVWYSTDTVLAEVALLDAFEKATGVTLDRVTIPNPEEDNTNVKWAGGSRPDLMYYHPTWAWISKLGGSESFVDLAPLGNFDRYSSDAIRNNYRTPDGKTYEWGAFVDFPAMGGWFYNKDVFAANGLSVPTTLDELGSTCEALKAKAPDIPCIYVAGDADSQWTTTLIPGNLQTDMPHAASPALTTKEQIDATIDSPELLASYTFLKKATDSGWINEDWLTTSYAQQVQALAEGTAAIVPQGSWFVTTMADANGFDVLDHLGAFGLSADDQTVWVALDKGWMVPKTGDAAKEAAAQEFIKFITSPTVQADFLAQTKLPSAFSDVPDPQGVPVPIQELAAAAKEHSNGSSDRGFLGGFADNGIQYATQVMTNEITPEQAVENIRQDVYKATSAATGTEIK